jgi:hypothetical protein
MKSSSSSPTTLYSESFLDSSNNSIPKICIFGKKCRSLKKGQAPCLSDIHVDDPEKMIEEIKQKFAEAQIKQNESVENKSAFHVPSFTSDIPNTLKAFTKIPNARYAKAISDIKTSVINVEKAISEIKTSLISLEFFTEIDDKVDTPKIMMSEFLSSIVNRAIDSESPTMEKKPDMNVVFGNSSTNFVMSSITKSDKSSKLAKLNSDDINDDSISPWTDVMNRKDAKKAKQDNAVSTITSMLKAERASPVPTMKAERASPVPTMKAERASPIPIMKSERASPVLIKKVERASPVPESKISSGKIFKMKCNYKEKCNKPDCSYEHPSGYVPGSIGPNMCHNATKCFNQNCKFTHPDGYVPKPNVRCLGGDECHKEKMKKGSCPFSHPDDKYWNDIPENTRKYNKKF